MLRAAIQEATTFSGATGNTPDNAENLARLRPDRYSQRAQNTWVRGIFRHPATPGTAVWQSAVRIVLAAR